MRALEGKNVPAATQASAFQPIRDGHSRRTEY